MKYFSAKILLTLLIPVCFSSVQAQIPEGYEKGLSTISKEEILKNITFLASDSLKGRAAGSKEGLIAAMYIAENFQRYGLKPLYKSLAKVPVKKEEEFSNPIEENELNTEDAGQYSLYFQKFNIKKTKLNSCSFILNNDKKNGNTVISFKHKNDFLVQYSGTDDISFNAPVVFAGYGINKGEDGYNDFVDENGKEIDVRNKIVIVVDGFPREKDSESAFSKSRNVLYRNPMRKADIAEEKGALAIIVISSPYKNDPPINFKYEKMLSTFDRNIYSVPEFGKRDIPVIYINKNVTLDIFKNSGKKLKAILDKIDENLKPQAFEFEGKTLQCDIKFDSEMLNTQNVIGYLEGTDPVLKNECIVIGGHYDHVGLGYYGAMSKSNAGKIHNGADDNASGTCGVIELAEAFSKNPPKRSILFIAFTGEENGMLGSRYYVYEQPLIPLANTVAMINLDMISRNEPQLLWVGGAFYSSDFIKIAERANKKVGLELLYNTGLLSSASDQAPFLKRNIPALFLFSGMHDDYHTPEDDVDRVSIDKIQKVTQLAYLSGWITANESAKPAYREAGMAEKQEIVKESLARQHAIQKK